MRYARLNADGSFWYEPANEEVIVWDEKNICTVAALVKDGKADQFNVVELYESPPPVIDKNTYTISRDGAEIVEGRWTYKWRIDPISEEVIAQNSLRKERKFKKDLYKRVQERLDKFANTKGYDSIVAACTYANSKNYVFRSDGQYCVYARDKTWETLFAILKEVDEGLRPKDLSFEPFEMLLPPLIWPST